MKTCDTQAQLHLEDLIEEGAAFARLTGLEARGPEHAVAPADRVCGAQSSVASSPEHFEVVVIGGGQAGLSVGYYLARYGIRFVILDAAERIGDTWRGRWDSLRLFTPAKFSGLVGMRFPAPGNIFPTKDEMGDYLETYATHFQLPVRSGVRVERLSKQNGRYLVQTHAQNFEADQVVVAMAGFQYPRLPAFAKDLRNDIRQLHSSEYKNPGQLREGPVLLVGAGNSGAEIAFEVARQHKTLLSGRHPGHVPFRIDGLAGRLLMVRLVLRVLFHRLLTVRTPLGRAARAKALHRAMPLIRVKPPDLAAAHVEYVSRVAAVQNGLPQLEDGCVLDVANIIWCTGFHPGFSWIDLPAFDTIGDPDHESGIARTEPGLYFVGLHFLHSLSSGMIHGVQRDAKRIAQVIATRQ